MSAVQSLSNGGQEMSFPDYQGDIGEAVDAASVRKQENCRQSFINTVLLAFIGGL
jgi:hypothetical protein